MQQRNTLVSIIGAALVATSQASPLSFARGLLASRAVVGHDTLSPVAERVQSGDIGTLISKFNPALHIAHGCQPYPAVADNGDVSGGLQDTGNPSAGCRDEGKAQTYARAKKQDNGQLAIMYAWYMPKDQPNAGNVAGGHRHDWENIVIFLDSATASSAKLVNAGASGHGEYKKSATPNMSGDTVQVEYFTNFPTNHELQFTATAGVKHAVNDWDAMPQAARDGLTAAQFGDATVPFKDDTLDGNIDKARS